MINVLVVDDSAFMRKLITGFINEVPGMHAKDTARNGKEALAKIRTNDYDVVTLDIEMPEMNGLEALKHIMKERPLPVVMVSSLTKEGAQETIYAMENGAVDFVLKPSGSISLNLHEVKEELIFKMKTAAHVNVEAQFSDRKQSKKSFRQQALPNSAHLKRGPRLLAIGTSTGGPKALQHLLPRLIRDFPAPIFIVQHMPPGFTYSLAERLHQLSEITVKEAVDGEVAKNGTAYIAPGGKQLKVRKMGRSLITNVTSGEPVNRHSPSVDTLFFSLSQLKGYKMAGLIMTGMGKDGAEGLRAMKTTHDCLALTESENTAVVYGMPKAAGKIVKVDYTLDLFDMASFLNTQFKK